MSKGRERDWRLEKKKICIENRANNTFKKGISVAQCKIYQNIFFSYLAQLENLSGFNDIPATKKNRKYLVKDINFL